MKKQYLLLPLLALALVACEDSEPAEVSLEIETPVVAEVDEPEVTEVEEAEEAEVEEVLEEAEDIESEEEEGEDDEEASSETVVDAGMNLFLHKGFTVMHPDDLTPQISDSANEVSFVSASGEVAMEIMIQDGDYVTSLEGNDPSVAKSISHQDGVAFLKYNSDIDYNPTSITYYLLSPNGLQTYSINFPFLTEESELSEAVFESFALISE